MLRFSYPDHKNEMLHSWQPLVFQNLQNSGQIKKFYSSSHEVQIGSKVVSRIRSSGSPFKNSNNQPGKSEDNTLLNFNFNSKVFTRTSSSYYMTSYFLLTFIEFCGFNTLCMLVLFSIFLNALENMLTL